MKEHKNNEKESSAESAESEGKQSLKLRAKDLKQIFFIIGFIVLIVGVFLFSKYMAENKEVLTPDTLHKMNLNGELNPEEGYVYNGFSFIRFNNVWLTRIKVPNTEGYINLELRYGAREVEDVKILGDPNYLAQFNSSFVTFDPTAEDLSSIALAASDLAENMVKVLDIHPVAACTKNETEACASRPIINCEDNPNYPVYTLRNSDTNAIIAEGNCITIQGDGVEIVKAVDRLVLMWYGVMPSS